MPKLSDVRLTKRIIDAAKPGDCISDCEVRGFRLIVSKTGARRFVATYRVGGRSSMIAVGTYPIFTVEQAREAARLELQKARAGIDPVASKKARNTAPIMSDLAEIYLGEYAQSRDLRAASIGNARGLLTHALPVLGRRRVSEVTKSDIRKLHGEVRAAGIAEGHKGVYRANRLLAVLSKMFSLAIERDWRTDNPCKGVAKFPEDQRWRNLGNSEVARLLEACDAYEGKEAQDAMARGAADAIRLLLFTGARLREVLRAEWGQFDLEVGLWEKPSSHTKAKRQHRLELDGPALELLREMRERATHPVLLFPGEPSKRPRRDAVVVPIIGQTPVAKPRADLKRPWAWIADHAGLDGVRLHDLRRTTASFMLSGGASLATVGKALGHTQASTTQRYAHLSQSVQREGLRMAGERMAALKGTAKRADVLDMPARTVAH